VKCFPFRDKLQIPEAGAKGQGTLWIRFFIHDILAEKLKTVDWMHRTGSDAPDLHLPLFRLPGKGSVVNDSVYTRSRLLRASNPDPNQKHQHSPDNHLKGGAEKGRIHKPLSDPANE
jgi:hypothetical protein